MYPRRCSDTQGRADHGHAVALNPPATTFRATQRTSKNSPKMPPSPEPASPKRRELTDRSDPRLLRVVLCQIVIRRYASDNRVYLGGGIPLVESAYSRTVPLARFS